MQRCRWFGGALAALFLIAACDNATGPTFEGPPPLPEEGSVLPGISLFLDFEGTSGTNFAAAMQLVEQAHAATTQATGLPILLLTGAQNEIPTEQSDGYHWTYSVTEGGLVADVDLKGRARANVDAVWELRVTSATTVPELTNYVLLAGVANLLGTSGQWRLFDVSVPASAVPLLDMAWVHDEGESWRVVFTNVRTGDAAIGDYIYYQQTAILRRMGYADQSAGNLSYVDWSVETNAGYLTDNSGVKACWNAAFENIACD